MARSVVFTVTLGCVLVALPVLADPPVEVVDQVQAVVDTTVGGLAVGGASDQILAQTVTVGVDGTLDGVLLPIACDSGQLILEITTVDPSGEPGATVLATSRIPAGRVAAVGPTFQNVPVHGRLGFSAGDHFAIVLSNPRGSCGVFQGPVGDSYPRGEGYFDARPNPPGWLPFSEFPSARHDLPFMTVMQVR